MAAETRVISRIDTTLRAIIAEVGDLPDRASAWDNETDDNQVAFHLEWKELMDRLEGLDRACRDKQMTADQQILFRSLLRNLREALPIVERLDLYRPPVALRA